MKISANGISINCEVEGPEDAPVITFSNSLATTYRMWDGQAAALSSRYRVVRYDTRGHGATDAPDEPYTMELLAEDAAAMLDALGIEKTHWVGLSMGGMIGQILALDCPDRLLSVTLCDTSNDMSPMREMWDERIASGEKGEMELIADLFMTRWFTPAFMEHEPAKAKGVRDMIVNTPAPGFVGCCHALRGFKVGDRIADIGVPANIIVGEHDAMAEPCIDMRRAVPEACLTVIGSAAHVSNVEQPIRFNAAVTGFIDSL